MTQPIVVRASSLPSYPDCPRRFAARTFKDVVIAAGFELRALESSIGAAVGSAVHAGAALILTEKAATGSPAPESAATDAAVEALHGRVEKEGALYDKETPNMNDGENQVVRMVRAYCAHIEPTVNPILVEERLEAEAIPGLIVSGQQDVLAREPSRIRDLKTGKKRSHYKPQLGIYSLLAKTHGYDVTGVAEDFVPRASMKKPQPEPKTFVHDLAAAETAAVAVLRHIDSDLKTFREGDPVRGILPGDPWAFPANPSSILCSAKWCPAHGTEFCHEHQSDQSEE